MAAPVKSILELIVNGQVRHGNNPVLTWQASNAATQIDDAGNLKWSKKKSSDKIDGLVAATMGLGRYLLKAEVGSVYEGRGVMTLDAAPGPAPAPEAAPPAADSWWTNFGDEDED
jgi:Phage terminase-like protein, large subunit